MKTRDLALMIIGVYTVGLAMGVGGMILVMQARERDYHLMAEASARTNNAYGELAKSRNSNAAILSACLVYALEAKDQAKVRLFSEELLTESLRPLLSQESDDAHVAEVLAELRAGARQSPTVRQCLLRAEQPAKAAIPRTPTPSPALASPAASQTPNRVPAPAR